MTVGQFAEAVQGYCQATGGSVTSWGRTPKRNARVGGAKASYHLLWRGLDVVYDTIIAVGTRKALAKRAGLRIITESDHDHIQPIG